MHPNYRSTRLSAMTNWKNCTVCTNRYDKLNMIFFNSISVFKTITAKQKIRTVFYKLVWTLYTPEIVHQSDARALSFLFRLSRAKGSSIIDDIRVPSLLYITVHILGSKSSFSRSFVLMDDFLLSSLLVNIFFFGFSHRRSMEKEAKANRRHCFMGENCRAHASIQTV